MPRNNYYRGENREKAYQGRVGELWVSPTSKSYLYHYFSKK